MELVVYLFVVVQSLTSIVTLFWPLGNFDRCSVVKCPPIDSSICNLVTPPGSCCPICGSMIRSLYSKQDLRRHQKYIDYNPITVQDIIINMRQLLKVVSLLWFVWTKTYSVKISKVFLLGKLEQDFVCNSTRANM